MAEYRVPRDSMVSPETIDEAARSIVARHKKPVKITGKEKKDMPSPTLEQQHDPLFEAIWQTIKSWDVNVPEYYEGYCEANGSHVLVILEAVKETLAGQS